MKRKEFLALSLSPLLISKIYGKDTIANTNTKFSIGMQLYTLRDLVDINLSKTLADVAKAGYDNLELYPIAQGNFFGLEPATCKKMLGDLGLQAPSLHIPFNSTYDKAAVRTASFTNGLDALLDGANVLGSKYVVLPHLPGDVRQTADDYKKIADRLNKVGEAAKAKGLAFCYHNHSFEFDALAGSAENGYQILLANTDPNNVKFELDIYWFLRAKQSANTLFEKHPGRFPLWHMKDLGPLPKQETYPVGKGSIDWKQMLNFSSKAGLQYAFIEQDNHPTGTPLENVKESLTYLTALVK